MFVAAKFGPGARRRRGGGPRSAAPPAAARTRCWRSPAGAAGCASSATPRSSTRCGGCCRRARTRRRSAWWGGWRHAGTWCASSATCCASTTPKTRDPGILRQPIERPIFITGLPRSGTTFLHRLLLEDPDNRAPLVWQTIYPYPPSARAGCASGARGAAVAHVRAAGAGIPRAASARCHLAAGVQRDHRARVPEPALRHELPHPELSATGWIRPATLPAYRFHRRFLQHLQHQTPGGQVGGEVPRSSVRAGCDPRRISRCPAGLRASRSGEGPAVGGQADRGGAAAVHAAAGSARDRPAGKRPLAGGHAADDGGRRRCRSAGAGPPRAAHGTGGGPGRHGRRRCTGISAWHLTPDAAAAVDRYAGQRPNGGYGPRDYRFEDHGLDAGAEREKFRALRAAVRHFVAALAPSAEGRGLRAAASSNPAPKVPMNFTSNANVMSAAACRHRPTTTSKFPLRLSAPSWIARRSILCELQVCRPKPSSQLLLDIGAE